jgi:hypothetical protein
MSQRLAKVAIMCCLHRRNVAIEENARDRCSHGVGGGREMAWHDRVLEYTQQRPIDGDSAPHFKNTSGPANLARLYYMLEVDSKINVIVRSSSASWAHCDMYAHGTVTGLALRYMPSRARPLYARASASGSVTVASTKSD